MVLHFLCTCVYYIQHRFLLIIDLITTGLLTIINVNGHGLIQRLSQPFVNSPFDFFFPILMTI